MAVYYIATCFYISFPNSDVENAILSICLIPKFRCGKCNFEYLPHSQIPIWECNFEYLPHSQIPIWECNFHAKLSFANDKLI